MQSVLEKKGEDWGENNESESDELRTVKLQVPVIITTFRLQREKRGFSRATLAVTLRPRARRAGLSSPTPAATSWPIARDVRVRAAHLGGVFPPENLPFSFFRLGVFPPPGLINHGFASQTSFATGKRETWVVSGRIRRPEKATALGESSLDLVVPAPRPPARGVKRARVLSAFFPSPFSEKVHIYRFCRLCPIRFRDGK